jgi:hypothetical protein
MAWRFIGERTVRRSLNRRVLGFVVVIVGIACSSVGGWGDTDELKGVV